MVGFAPRAQSAVRWQLVFLRSCCQPILSSIQIAVLSLGSQAPGRLGSWMGENSSGPQAMVVQSIVSRTEEKSLFVLLQSCTSNVPQLTSVEPFTKSKSGSGFASLYCGSSDAFSLDYRRKCIGAAVKWGTPLPCFVKFCHTTQSGHLCCWALRTVHIPKCSHLIGSLGLAESY